MGRGDHQERDDSVGSEGRGQEERSTGHAGGPSRLPQAPQPRSYSDSRSFSELTAPSGLPSWFAGTTHVAAAPLPLPLRDLIVRYFLSNCPSLPLPNKISDCREQRRPFLGRDPGPAPGHPCPHPRPNPGDELGRVWPGPGQLLRQLRSKTSDAGTSCLLPAQSPGPAQPHAQTREKSASAQAPGPFEVRGLCCAAGRAQVSGAPPQEVPGSLRAPRWMGQRPARPVGPGAPADPRGQEGPWPQPCSTPRLMGATGPSSSGCSHTAGGGGPLSVPSCCPSAGMAENPIGVRRHRPLP